MDQIPNTNPAKQQYLSEEQKHSRGALNHNHIFFTMAEDVQGHQHMLLGTTSPAISKKDHHIHRLIGRTSYGPRNSPPHWHGFETLTGPDFETPDGNHIHYYAGTTSSDLEHCHAFSSVTDISPEYMPCDQPPPGKKRPL